MTNHSLITLGELLSSENETIRRNAMSILKTLQNPTGIKCVWCKKLAFSKTYREIDGCTGSSVECEKCISTETEELLKKYH